MTHKNYPMGPITRLVNQSSDSPDTRTDEECNTERARRWGPTVADEIKALESKLEGLKNDARYWDLRRTYGDYSREVLRHLESCARSQGVA